MRSTRVGAQFPRVRVEPKRAYTDGEAAAELSAAYGNTLDPWQKLVLDCWLGRDEGGNLTAMTCGIPCPRQNGKNGVIEAFELDMLLNVPDTHILHTAHQVKTSNKAFKRLAAIFENRRHPELNAELKSVRRTNGEQAIELANGNTIEYASRGRGSARGFDAITCVIYDEAQELTDEHVEAIMSTLAASPTGDRQIIYAGTPPSPRAPGEVFKRIRRAALEHPSPKMAWHEWSVDSTACPVTAGMAYDEVRDMVFDTNPAMGVRLDDEFTEEEFSTMSPDGFARERLGWWDSNIASFDAAIKATDWAACAVDEPPKDGKTSLGVKFAADGDRAAVAVCRTPEGGEPFVELVDDYSMPEQLSDIADLVASKQSRVACVAVDGKAYSGALSQALGSLGVSPRMVELTTADNVTTAAAMLGSRAAAHTVHHIKVGYTDALTSSVTGSAKRPIGNRGAWGLGDGSARSYMAEAASLALWANETTKRDPEGGIAIW